MFWLFLQITIEAMKSDIDEVALQGIEFWSNVCDEEMDLAIEASEVCAAGAAAVGPSLLSEGSVGLNLPVCCFRPRSRDAPQSTPVNSMPKGLCSTWCPSSPRPSPSR